MRDCRLHQTSRLNGLKLVPVGRSVVGIPTLWQSFKLGMKISEMFPVLMTFSEMLPHSPGTAPLVEMPCADTLNSLGRTFCS